MALKGHAMPTGSLRPRWMNVTFVPSAVDPFLPGVKMGVKKRVKPIFGIVFKALRRLDVLHPLMAAHQRHHI